MNLKYFYVIPTGQEKQLLETGIKADAAGEIMLCTSAKVHATETQTKKKLSVGDLTALMLACPNYTLVQVAPEAFTTELKPLFANTELCQHLVCVKQEWINAKHLKIHSKRKTKILQSLPFAIDLTTKNLN